MHKKNNCIDPFCKCPQLILQSRHGPNAFRGIRVHDFQRAVCLTWITSARAPDLINMHKQVARINALGASLHGGRDTYVRSKCIISLSSQNQAVLVQQAHYTHVDSTTREAHARNNMPTKWHRVAHRLSTRHGRRAGCIARDLSVNKRWEAPLRSLCSVSTHACCWRGRFALR